VQGTSQLFQYGAEFGRLCRDYSFGAQLAYLIFQASTPEMPGYEAAKQAPGRCDGALHLLLKT